MSDDFCHKIQRNCLTDYDAHAQNLCPVNMTENRRDCIMEHKKLYFYSAQFEYQQACSQFGGQFTISTITFIGTLLGNIVLGYLADKYGRRTIYFLSILFGIPVLVLSAAIKSVYWFYFFHLLVESPFSGTLTVGYTVPFIYLTSYTVAYASQSICLEAAYLSLVELMPTDVRATVGSIANICMKVGTILASFTIRLKFEYEPSIFFINLMFCVIGMVLVFFCLEESREADMKMVGQTAVGKIFSYDEEVSPPGNYNISPPKTTETQDSKTPQTPELPIVKTPSKPLVSAEQLKIIEKNNERNRPIVDKPPKRKRRRRKSQ
ncbi:hypothetical protein CAEBREN_31516 [Caenorhabditis brenneri]|uniref:Major facilitator superfamily (MFS) profile domain-containing protein n=1 Tax=Caenorhabditis brenneri TaxID=135651 RepID=G0P698_CAEBE|nr:hypothetical protein CAEBREN_31516 [Caenorhabditis brenneri]